MKVTLIPVPVPHMARTHSEVGMPKPLGLQAFDLAFNKHQLVTYVRL